MKDSLTDRLRTERDEALELADSGVEAAAELREFASLMGEAMLEIARLESLAGVRVRRDDEFNLAIERGTKAWADVPDNWLEELRGSTNDEPKGFIGDR